MKIIYTREEWRKIVEEDAKRRADKGLDVKVSSQWQSAPDELFSVEVYFVPVEFPSKAKVVPTPVTLDDLLKGM